MSDRTEFRISNQPIDTLEKLLDDLRDERRLTHDLIVRAQSRLMDIEKAVLECEVALEILIKSTYTF